MWFRLILFWNKLSRSFEVDEWVRCLFSKENWLLDCRDEGKFSRSSYCPLGMRWRGRSTRPGVVSCWHGGFIFSLSASTDIMSSPSISTASVCTIFDENILSISSRFSGRLTRQVYCLLNKPTYTMSRITRR